MKDIPDGVNWTKIILQSQRNALKKTSKQLWSKNDECGGNMIRKVISKMQEVE